MTSGETADVIRAWVNELIPELREPRSDPTAKWPLPDLSVAVTNIHQAPGQTQQSPPQKRRTCLLLIAVDPDPADSALAMLYSFADKLMDELARDPRMGGRVSGSDPVIEADLNQPVFTTDDGAEALLGSLTVTVLDSVVA